MEEKENDVTMRCREFEDLTWDGGQSMAVRKDGEAKVLARRSWGEPEGGGEEGGGSGRAVDY